MRKMAEEYDDEENYQQEDQNDGDIEEIYRSSSGGTSYLTIGFIVVLITISLWEYYQITGLKSNLKRLTGEKLGAEQTLSDQKNKASSKDLTISQLESRIQDLQTKLTEVQSSAERYRSQAESEAEAKAQAANREGEYDSLFKAEDLRTMTFKGAKHHPSGSAKLLWSQKLGVLYVNVTNLEKTPDGKEYQLWGNEGDKFFSVGTFTVDDSKKGVVKLTPPTDLGTKKISDFVVTLEKKGGSEKLTRPFFLSGSWYQ